MVFSLYSLPSRPTAYLHTFLLPLPRPPFLNSLLPSRQHQPLTTSDSIAPIQIAQYENWMVLIFCVYFAHVNDFNIENVYYIYRL